MTKENENQQDEKLLSFVPNLLSGLKSIDADRYATIYKFFQAAFLELADHELFDDVTYRIQWQDHLEVIRCASIPFIGYTNEEIRIAINVAENVIIEHRKKLQDA